MADYRQADSVADASLQHIINNTDRQIAVSADPVTHAGVAAVTLAVASMVPGDFTLGAGTVSGRKLSWARKTPVTPIATGTATHVVFVDDTNSEILLMWPVEAVGLTSAVNTDFAAGEHEIRSPEGA